jgi:CheY-like chemotaxis protein
MELPRELPIIAMTANAMAADRDRLSRGRNERSHSKANRAKGVVQGSGSMDTEGQHQYASIRRVAVGAAFARNIDFATATDAWIQQRFMI